MSDPMSEESDLRYDVAPLLLQILQHFSLKFLILD